MKIAYILGKYPCLSETFAANEISALRKTGQNIFVFANESSKQKKQTHVFYKPSFFCLNSIYLFLKFFIKSPSFFFKFCRVALTLFSESPNDGIYLLRNIHTIAFFCSKAKAEQIEHIHSYFLSRPACIGLAISEILNIDFSIAAHARDIYVETGALKTKVAKAKFIVCCTETGKKYLQHKLPQKYNSKIHLNYHGVKDRFAERKNKKTCLKILSIGRLVPKKGFDYFIKAMAIVIKSDPFIKAEIIGEGYEQKKLKDLIIRLGISKNIHLTGAKTHNETLKSITQADILVAASVITPDGDRDGIANVILEAFASGCVVTASKLETIREVVKDETTGLLVEQKRVKQLAKAIIRLINDEKLRKKLTENAYQFVKKNFDIQKNTKQQIKLFQKQKHTKKIKIAHVLEGFAGGTATYINNTLIRLQKKGYDITFICSLIRAENNGLEIIENLEKHGVRVFIVNMQREINILKDIKSFIAILKILTTNKFDIIHSHCSKAGALCRVAGLIAGIKIRIHTPHCFAFTRCPKALNKHTYLVLEKILAAITTKFVFVGKAEKHIAEKHKIATPDKYKVVQNGLAPQVTQLTNLEKNAYKKQLGINTDYNVVATICRLTQYKGVNKFIQAAKLSKIKNTLFLIAGQGDLKQQIEKTIIEQDLTKKVLMLGQIQDMDRLYGICDVVTLCSTAEGQSYVILEAMRSRCAIVASSVIGNIELLEENRGVLVENKPENIAAGIDSILTDKNRCQKMKNRAYEHFLKHHNIENQVDKLSNVYKSVLREKK